MTQPNRVLTYHGEIVIRTDALGKVIVEPHVTREQIAEMLVELQLEYERTVDYRMADMRVAGARV